MSWAFFLGFNMTALTLEEKIDEHDKEISTLKQDYHHLKTSIKLINQRLDKVDHIYTEQVNIKAKLINFEDRLSVMREILFTTNKTIDNIEAFISQLNYKLNMIKYLPVFILSSFVLALMFNNSTLENLIKQIL